MNRTRDIFKIIREFYVSHVTFVCGLERTYHCYADPPSLSMPVPKKLFGYENERKREIDPLTKEKRKRNVSCPCWTKLSVLALHAILSPNWHVSSCILAFILFCGSFIPYVGTPLRSPTGHHSLFISFDTLTAIPLEFEWDTVFGINVKMKFLGDASNKLNVFLISSSTRKDTRIPVKSLDISASVWYRRLF